MRDTPAGAAALGAEDKADQVRAGVDGGTSIAIPWRRQSTGPGLEAVGCEFWPSRGEA